MPHDCIILFQPSLENHAFRILSMLLPIMEATDLSEATALGIPALGVGRFTGLPAGSNHQPVNVRWRAIIPTNKWFCLGWQLSSGSWTKWSSYHTDLFQNSKLPYELLMLLQLRHYCLQKISLPSNSFWPSCSCLCVCVSQKTGTKWLFLLYLLHDTGYRSTGWLEVVSTLDVLCCFSQRNRLVLSSWIMLPSTITRETMICRKASLSSSEKSRYSCQLPGDST